MKKIPFIIFFFLAVSCYKGEKDDPSRPQRYVASWGNDTTLVSGKVDPVSPRNTVPHYSFYIMQSEVTVLESYHPSSVYRNWRVDYGKVPPTLVLYDEVTDGSSVEYSVTREPYLDGAYSWHMELTSAQGVAYRLSPN